MRRMRHASIRSLSALAVAGLGASVIAGCGNDVPPNAVAKVGDSVITQAEFDKWLKTGAASQAQAGHGQVAVPDPPDFANCVAAKRKQPLPKGQKKPGDAELKKQCEQEYETLRGEVMQFLIQAEWVLQEAEEQGIEVSDEEVKRSLEEQKQASFPNEKAYQEYIKTSGLSEEDILFRVKLDQLQQKLTQKITESAGKVSDEDIASYYEEKKQDFAQPERRDLRVVLTKSQAKADEAKAALEGGQGFAEVAKQYSIDEASKAQGGKLPAVAKGQQEKAFDDAIFAARKGELKGPVKTQFGWYVFEVTKIQPASQQTLEESKETIRNLLRSERQQKTLNDFIKDFREDYRADTDCAEDYRIAECSNAPEEDTGTAPASGGAPQGQQQGTQPVPQPQPQVQP
jgi:foldase protein PrsA